MCNKTMPRALGKLPDDAIHHAQQFKKDIKNPATHRVLLIVAGVVTLCFAVYFAVTKAKTEDDVHHVKLAVILAALASLQAFKALYTFFRPKSPHTDDNCLIKMFMEHMSALVIFALLAIACSPFIPFARYADIEVALPIEFELLFGTYVCWELMRIPSRLQKMKE